MKLTKLMLSASVAALALVSCNKMDTTPEVAKRLKSVEVSLENVAVTKGLAGDKIEAGDAVAIKDFQLFLTDASGNEYNAKVADGSADAQTYWSTADLANGPISASFHYVDPNCTKVVAVANVGKKLSFAEYKALAALQVGNQQDQATLALYDEKNLVTANKQHNDTNANGTVYVADVYKADLVLTPRVSRFEVDGFTVKFNTTPKYNEIKVTQLAIQNYYPATSLVTGVESGDLVNHMPNLTNQAQVYTWLDTPADAVWYRDYFDLTITPASATKDTPNDLAYHLFSSNVAPVMVIKLLADNLKGLLQDRRNTCNNIRGG